ncbi:iron(III) transport system ATP-binding protein [Austwickia chelonae]|uniref:Putative ABC transporter ATP-binding protein n=1 Tax=Austwickia chelonae NBRC 105200 TaxID=1184607 RepID=K6VQV3_9MICO|nr:ABC transporter ATP-binding protein [Austwickia chelonae]GAB79109.1 putative ABC transporter ATP-binding protein [Austwickia chelonae NBRC 105200]SEW42327.1 iron(III) transport system ATP-binding protein [Austwickia chelonae]
MTGQVELSGVSVRFPGASHDALHDVALSLPADSVVTVVGPSGSGKTSLLRAVAGLERPVTGTISIDGRDRTGEPPAARPTAMVFQGDALFPELTVRENVGYGLSLRGLPAAALVERVDIALLQLGLTGVSHLFPEQLSGGQARRVALARSWILRPSVLLLDEPLQGLEPRLRRQLLDLIVRTRARLGGTVIHVTHDLGGALSTADVLVVMEQGRVCQVGSPREVYARPSSAFVAEFLGEATMLPVKVDEVLLQDGRTTARVRLLGRDLEIPAEPGATRAGRQGTVLLRPYSVRAARLTAAEASRHEVRGDIGVVQEVRYLGERIDYLVETVEGVVLASSDPFSTEFGVDEFVRVDIRADRSWLLPGPL